MFLNISVFRQKMIDEYPMVVGKFQQVSEFYLSIIPDDLKKRFITDTKQGD